MQINSIEIEGLWAYREPQRIDIAGQSLIVGVGENGAGKSALLVGAIVVAFYGKFQTKTIEEAITTGAPQGRVSVEFELNGSQYRVGRTYPRTGTPNGQVLIADPTQKSGWRSLLNGKGITETTDYMVGLLGMDYKTATMTWIAEQGQYGKFATAQPVERFNLLSGIFGLDAYGPKAAAANAKFKEAEAEVARIDGRIAELTGALEETEVPAVDGISALTDDDLRTKSDHSQAEVDRVVQAIAELNAGDPARKTVEARQAYELVRNARVSTLTTATASNSRANSALLSAQSRGTAAKQSAQYRFDDAVKDARARSADQKGRAADARRDALQALTSIASAQAQLPNLTDAVTGYWDAAADARSTAATVNATVTGLRTRHAALKAEWATVKQSAEDSTARIETLRRTADDADHASCFSCGQHLTAADALALVGSQERDIDAAHTKMGELRAEAVAAGQNADAADTERDIHLAKANEFDREATRAAQTVTRAEALIATKAERESTEAQAVAVIARAGKDESAALTAASSEHNAALTAATTEETEATGVAQAEIKETGAIIEATSVPTDAEAQLEATLIAAESLVAGEAAAVEIQRTALNSERDVLRREDATYMAEFARRAEAKTTREAQGTRLLSVQKERKVAITDSKLHATLHKAYSPGGIPAMILAGVIEQLNESVNAALTPLSRGELSVILRTSRETSKGTAENKVSVFVETPTGTRAYETLSGGQKFRVDLAIRSGLAATIARGTGTPIKTFILDEGWGTLDEKGIQSTIDTLFRLSEETNVITVSHVDAVRDAFPARVEVSMSGGSSVAQLVAA